MKEKLEELINILENMKPMTEEEIKKIYDAEIKNMQRLEKLREEGIPYIIR